ncbi:MAG: hypothetical protein Q7T81_15515 [Pseudolabrys sp.]|nr:hypothetical protein [Pseudolabrys sp.]
MPHVIVEYSTNIEPALSPRAVLEEVHAAVLATGVFKLAAIRTRAEPRDLYVIADGDPSHAFINVMLRIGVGRDEATKTMIVKTIMDRLAEISALLSAKAGLNMLVEIQEIAEPALRKGNMHERFAGGA